MGHTRRDFLRTSACALGGLAAASSFESLRAVSALTPQAATDYRALVCVFLNGGNDGNNTVVPLDATGYGQYSAARSAASLAIPQANLLPINPPSQGRQFGLHPNLASLQEVWSQGDLAVLCNVGPLVEPMTRTTYRNGTGRKPLQLFSHSDQVNLWQSSIADAVTKAGWGGRVADRTGVLNGGAAFPQVVSVFGLNVFVTGNISRPLAVADSNTPLSQVLPLSMSGPPSETVPRRAAFEAMIAQAPDAKLLKASNDTRSVALQTAQILQSAPPRDFPQLPANTSIGRQLEQVARIIALRDALSVRRQIFFCQVFGFDTHANQRQAGNPVSQDQLLLDTALALRGFWDALGELGVRDSVTAFTLSDFGRTLDPAGSGGGVGSDHGWGNHHLIMGGAVRGGDFYGTFPTLVNNGPDDTDNRGRWIPTTSVEQYAATLATWYGLSASDLPAVFPLIDRFATPNLGFML